MSYYKVKNKNIDSKKILNELTIKNDLLLDRVERLQVNTLDVDFIDQKIREKTGFLGDNEILILFD